MFILLGTAVLYYLLYHVLKLRPDRSIASCGLYGFSGKNPVEETKIRWLACLNETRGVHSTGIYTIGLGKNHKRSLLKKADKASVFVLHPEFSSIVSGSSMVLGHTRAATVGVVSEANAHPFEIGSVIGAHNGFVEQSLAKEFIGEDKIFKKEFDVDSQLIFALLDHFKGDYKMLSKLEGAITASFVIPDKYDDTLFLYRRTPRELHFGYAPEGIYYSSEKSPLELLGCRQITEITNNTMVVFKGGIVQDIQDLEPPRLKSLELNAQRFSWKNKISDAELEASGYEELKPVKSNHSYNQLFSARKQESFRVKGNTENIDNIVGSLVEQVKEEVALMTSVPVVAYMESDSYEDTDTEACLILFKLINNVDNKPVPGFLIYDKLNTKNASVTSLVGVTVLKFNVEQCNVNVNLILSDPVSDLLEYFTYTIKPQSGRVLEVALRLPFREGEETTQNNTNSRIKTTLSTLSNDLPPRGLQRNLLFPAVQPMGRLFDYEGCNTDSVQGESESVCSRHAVEEIHGVKGQENEGGGAICSNRIIPRRDGKTTPITINIFEARTIIEKENATFEFKSEIKTKLFKTTEYNYAANMLNKFCNNMFKVSSLLYGACIIKTHFIKNTKEAYSVAHYVVKLLELCPEEYKVIVNTPFSADDKIQIANFTHAFRFSSLIDLEQRLSYKKSKSFRLCQIG